LAARPKTPYQLAQLISGYKAIVASRLHAHVIASSYFVPSVGLLWDDKVLAFFKDTGREDLVFDNFGIKDVSSIVEALYKIMGRRVDKAIIKEKQELVLSNVQAILNAME
jgi:polysaccharide pyruvyl transferase WcaK-like protein